MKKMKKGIKLAGLIVGLAGALVLLGFVEGHRTSAACEVMNVQVKEVANALIDADEVRFAIQEYDGPQVGKPLDAINTATLEKVLMATPYVSRASVYKTIDKKLVVEIVPREPVVRVIDRKGHSALFDTKGCLIPVSESQPLRLPVITGEFEFDPEIVLRCEPIDNDTDKVLERIRDFAFAIVADPFWKAQLQHTYLDQNGDFISVARVGGHRINFGQGQDIDVKLNALDILYREGMDASTWNKYAAINLKYENQIICTEKN